MALPATKQPTEILALDEARQKKASETKPRQEGGYCFVQLAVPDALEQIAGKHKTKMNLNTLRSVYYFFAEETARQFAIERTTFSYGYMAKRLNLVRDAAIHYTKILLEEGLIIKVDGEGRTNQYILATLDSEKYKVVDEAGRTRRERYSSKTYPLNNGSLQTTSSLETTITPAIDHDASSPQTTNTLNVGSLGTTIKNEIGSLGTTNQQINGSLQTTSDSPRSRATRGKNEAENKVLKTDSLKYNDKDQSSTMAVKLDGNIIQRELTNQLQQLGITLTKQDGALRGTVKRLYESGKLDTDDFIALIKETVAAMGVRSYNDPVRYFAKVLSNKVQEATPSCEKEAVEVDPPVQGDDYEDVTSFVTLPRAPILYTVGRAPTDNEMVAYKEARRSVAAEVQIVKKFGGPKLSPDTGSRITSLVIRGVDGKIWHMASPDYGYCPGDEYWQGVFLRALKDDLEDSEITIVWEEE